MKAFAQGLNSIPTPAGVQIRVASAGFNPDQIRRWAQQIVTLLDEHFPSEE